MKKKVRRGEVYWVRLDPTEGGEINKTRPAVVISIDSQNFNSNVVIVIPLSTSIKKIYSFQKKLKINGIDCKVKCEQIEL